MEKEGWIAVPCETYLSLRLVQENNTFLKPVFRVELVDHRTVLGSVS